MADLDRLRLGPKFSRTTCAWAAAGMTLDQLVLPVAGTIIVCVAGIIGSRYIP
jgi:hypothetical protein